VLSIASSRIVGLVMIGKIHRPLVVEEKVETVCAINDSWLMNN
jgi:hypothetical protein